MGYFISILLCTLVLEDLALASSLALVSQSKMTMGQAFLACSVGISLGDLLCYVIGYCSSHFAFLDRLNFVQKHRPALEKFGRSHGMTVSIIVSRAIPGTRTPTYLSAGFLRYSPLRFFWLTVVTVLPWVFAALFGGRELLRAFMANWILTLACVVAVFYFGKRFFPRFFPRFFLRFFPRLNLWWRTGAAQ